MRLFYDKLELSKRTDRKVRWDIDVGGTKFELYIPDRQIPEPVPEFICVKIFDAPIARSRLLRLGIDRANDLLIFDYVGLNAREFREMAPGGTELLIVEAVEFWEDHTETVRYRPLGDPENWMLGEPYVPKSLLGDPYPERLLFVVGW